VAGARDSTDQKEYRLSKIVRGNVAETTRKPGKVLRFSFIKLFAFGKMNSDSDRESEVAFILDEKQNESPSLSRILVLSCGLGG
jgi:hypothetical protein